MLLMTKRSNYLTTAEAATFLGFTADYVRFLIREGKLHGEKLGRNWIVDKKQLLKIRRKRFPTQEDSENGSSE